MHGATRMIVNAQQAKLNNYYKNTELKLLKANAAIWFNKMCKVKRLKPNYINIKINGQKPQDKKTTINVIRFRINQEIKFLYRKKVHGATRMLCRIFIIYFHTKFLVFSAKGISLKGRANCRLHGSYHVLHSGKQYL